MIHAVTCTYRYYNMPSCVEIDMFKYLFYFQLSFLNQDEEGETYLNILNPHTGQCILLSRYAKQALIIVHVLVIMSVQFL